MTCKLRLDQHPCPKSVLAARATRQQHVCHVKSAFQGPALHDQGADTQLSSQFSRPFLHLSGYKSTIQVSLYHLQSQIHWNDRLCPDSASQVLCFNISKRWPFLKLFLGTWLWTTSADTVPIRLSNTFRATSSKVPFYRYVSA